VFFLQSQWMNRHDLRRIVPVLRRIGFETCFSTFGDPASNLNHAGSSFNHRLTSVTHRASNFTNRFSEINKVSAFQNTVSGSQSRESRATPTVSAK
jgi:hypothetical protein